MPMTMPKGNPKARPARKAGTTLRISVKLAAMAPEELVQTEKDARQAVVISLWQGGRLSTREAAGELGLGYYDYIDLLGKRGIPIVTEVTDEPILEAALEEIQRDRALRSKQ